jgi:septum formation protein
MDLILASTSPIRRSLLQAAGVAFRAQPPNVDETEVKDGHRGEDVELAIALAEAKALAVSRAEPQDMAIGSDSLVSVGGERFSKPRDQEEAADHLRRFSGRSMKLTSAVVLAQAGAVRWSHAETALLQVRELTDAFITDYLEAEWPEVAYCVGVFRLEARGVQLFSRIEGDHFTILGLPLVPLLGELRRQGVMPS